jgi:BMFP domain-containing protein YqiC
MKENQKLIEDVMSLGGNILGNLLGARHEFKAQAKQRMDGIARQLDLVTRSEFDAAFAMLAKARMMQEELNDRLTAIESHLHMSSAKKPVKTVKPNLPSVKRITPRSKRK